MNNARRNNLIRVRESFLNYLERNSNNIKVQRLWAFVLSILIGGALVLLFWSLEPSTNDDDEVQQEEIDPRPWFDKIPMPPIAVATSDTLPVGACKRQLKKYLEELENGTLWATQMFDASVKYPHGIIDGLTRHLGSFDQCYRIKALVNDAGCISNVYGKYCLVDFKYQRKEETDVFEKKLDLEFDPNDSVWETVKEKGDFRRVKRYMLQLAVCVPAVCSEDDIEQSLRGPYREFGDKHNLTVEVTVEKNNCQSSTEKRNFGIGAIFYSFTLLCVILLVVTSSLCDEEAITTEEEISENNKPLAFQWQLLMCFSARRNIRTIFEVKRHRHRGFEAIYKFRFVSTCIVIFDHRALTPVYAFVLFFNAFIFEHLGTGPRWESIVGVEANNCKSSWWAHLLYFNNYLTMDRICIFQSWYLAVDFQCYLLSILIIDAFCKRPRKAGYKILATVICISILVPFLVTYVYRIRPLLLVYPYITHLSMDSYFRDYYVKTHLRMTPYLVGVVAGAILYDCEKMSYRIPKRTTKILYILLYVVMTHAVQALGYPYLNPNSKPSSLEMALYACLHRGIYAVGISSLVLLAAMGDELDSQQHSFLAADYWAQPLARLTYSAFLSHNIVQAYQAATARSARTFSAHNLIWDFVPDIFFSFSLALLIVVFIEGPFKKLEKLIVAKYRLTSAPN